MDVHPAFKSNIKVTSDNMLWAEFKACMTMGIDPEAMFKKERNMRALITGGVIASNALENMRSFDTAEEHKRNANKR